MAIKRIEAGHRRVRAYAMAWGKISTDAAGSSRMSCYRALQSEGIIQPKRFGHNLREAAEQRRQRVTAPDKLNAVLQGDFTDCHRRRREVPHRRCDRVSESVQSGFPRTRHRDSVGLDRCCRRRAQKEIAELGHELTSRIILVTDNGPAMKSRRFRNFVKKTKLLIHVRSRKYHPQTI